MSSSQPPVRAAPVVGPLPLFPTMGSLQEVIDYGDSKLPVMSKNDLCSLLYIYHNTLLKLLQEKQQ